MTIIFDLDHTLLDMKTWKKMIADAFGVSEDVYYSSYEDYFYKNKIKYDPKKHLEYLIKIKEINPDKKEKIEKKMEKVIKNIDNALFPEAERVLKKFKEKYKLILITWGNKKWQKWKIDNLKINKYFSKIITADKDKDTCIDFLKNSDGEKIIINDNLKESIKLEKKLKNSKVFLIKSKYSRNHENKQPEHSLKDCLKLIK